ncbi:hypothetical protein BT69DRAFT_1276773 [Atractiella rhizophila]|nr:hypothetical protein BT69DRAFT_1276773 [Atractiella rhizophila]
MLSAKSLTIALLAFFGGVEASKLRRAFKPAVCKDVFFDIQTEASNVLFNLTVDSALDLIKAGDLPVGGTLDLFSVSGTFKLFGKLCGPSAPPASADTIQILSHAAFEYSKEFYTDFEPEKYSYVDIAANKGLYTFAFDRLGHGQSDKPSDGLLTVQSALHIEIWAKIAAGLRDGSIGGTSFKNIVGVGHSYAASLWNAVVTKHPDAVDAVAYLGYSHEIINPVFVTSLVPLPAALVSDRYADEPLTYLAIPKEGRRLGFYYLPGSFDPASLTADDENGGVFTLGEFLTLTLNQQSASNFGGHVAYFNGNQDGAFCPYYCGGEEALLSREKDYYGAAKSVTVKTFESTGHAVIQHYSAQAIITAVQDWVASLEF